MLLLVSFAFAADTWSAVAPGIDRLYRTTSGPLRIHAVTVDLARPEIWIRATREGERQATVPDWADDVGATVAINGDWFSYTDYWPVGLAIGGGWGWTGSVDAADWNFFACNVTKECWIDTPGTAAPWTPRAWNAVGGNGVLLVIDGAAQVNSDAFYASDLAPRSAVGISADGQTLYLVVVDGRSSSSVGATFNQMGALLLDLGAHDAMMLDGGGSSTLWATGSVVNDPSDGSPRTVSNHLGVMVGTSTDSRCATLPNGKYCLDATRLATCEGGAYAEGDCGYYGLACEEAGSFAYCVDPTCTNGGQAAYCVDSTQIGRCTDGVAETTGDCAYYGATCEVGAGTAWCVDYRCGGVGNQGWCDGERAYTCTMGAYAEADCAATGLVCDAGACVPPATDDTGIADTDPPDTDPDDDTDRPPATGARPGTLAPLDGLGCGCDGAGRSGAAWAALLAFFLGLERRGRGSGRGRGQDQRDLT